MTDIGRDGRWPHPGIVVLAAIGAALLLVVATSRWATPSDEHAYWLAGRRLLEGQPLYDLTATPITPYAYWYPPVVAQVMAPVAAVVPALWFTAAWTIVLLGCLIVLARGNVLVALALVAFVPVAVEFAFRNVHLVLAVLVVLGIKRWPILFAAGAAIKLAPGLGIVFLAARGRWRDAAAVTAVGLLVLAGSALLAPTAWRQYIEVLLARGPGDVSGFLPVPYLPRALLGFALAVLAGRLRAGVGDPLLVVAVAIALPTLWFTALSILVGVVPLLAWSDRTARAVSRDRPGRRDALYTSAE